MVDLKPKNLENRRFRAWSKRDWVLSSPQALRLWRWRWWTKKRPALLHYTPCIDDCRILVGGASLSFLCAYRRALWSYWTSSPPSLLIDRWSSSSIKVKEMCLTSLWVSSRFLHVGDLLKCHLYRGEGFLQYFSSGAQEMGQYDQGLQCL